MQEFDTAYAELEALSLARKYVYGKSPWSVQLVYKQSDGHCYAVQGTAQWYSSS